MFASCRSCVNSRKSPSYLSFESEAETFDRLLAEFKVLRSLGYDCFKLSPQHQVHLQKIPNSSVHGAQIDYAFEKGRILKEWLSEKDAVGFYKAIFVQCDLERALKAGVLKGSYKQFLAAYGHHGAWDGWYDTHARHSSVPPRKKPVPKWRFWNSFGTMREGTLMETRRVIGRGWQPTRD
jgi:hypothetical protein